MTTRFTGFAVFDVETTGFVPERNDRIIEIGIVRLDENLEVVEKWETLVDPGRDIGATAVHGITASDVKGAPTFSELVGDIWHRFEGAVPVAHNLVFDRRFILAELARAGVELPKFDGICTMQLAGQMGVSKGHRKLVELCEAFDICPSQAHSAGYDAYMCSEIFRYLSKDTDLSKQHSPLSSPELWRRPATPLGITRQCARTRPVESRLQEVASGICGASLGSNIPTDVVDEYLLILDRVLEDRVVDDSEVQTLTEFASECGMPAESLDSVHKDYVRALVSNILKDGVVTEAERSDLKRVAGLIGVDGDFIETCFSQGPTTVELPKESLAGKSVCFTGELRCKHEGQPIDRAKAEELARSAGMTPMPRVTKKLDILIVADPDSASGKAKKARDYGVRIIAEVALWRKLGVDVE